MLLRIVEDAPFFTTLVEYDFKEAAPQASALGVTLLWVGGFRDFVAEWCKKHELPKKFKLGRAPGNFLVLCQLPVGRPLFGTDLQPDEDFKT